MQEVFEKIIEKLEDAKKCGTKHYEDGKYIYTSPNYDHETLNKATEIVKQAAAEYNNGWIPCSERLPDSSCDVIITTRSLVNGVGSYFGEDSGWIQWYSGGGIAVDVIAWQPLPAPYKQKGE